MDSVPYVKAALELYSQLSQLWKSTGMYARKWLSNVSEVLQFIPFSDCALEVDFDRGELPPVKSLTFLWCPMEDVFHLKLISPCYGPTPRVVGKRSGLGQAGERKPVNEGFEVVQITRSTSERSDSSMFNDCWCNKGSMLAHLCGCFSRGVWSSCLHSMSL